MKLIIFLIIHSTFYIVHYIIIYFQSMIASYLITGGNSPERLLRAHSLIRKTQKITATEMERYFQSPDYLLFSPETAVGIEDIRKIAYQIFLKPYQYTYKAIVFEKAENMSIPSQNAFLKTLEEPPEKSLIILCTRDKNALLPTTVSRCQNIHINTQAVCELSGEEKENYHQKIAVILSSDLGAKFKLAEELGTGRDKTLEALEKLALSLRQILIDGCYGREHSGINLQNCLIFLKKSRQTKKYIEANVNPRLALENLFLTC